MGCSLANDACHRFSHEQQHEEERYTRRSQNTKNKERIKQNGVLARIITLNPQSIALGCLYAQGPLEWSLVK